MSNKRLRNACFTVNNYSDADIELLRALSKDARVKYLVFGKEVAPSTGTPHLQGYVSFTGQVSFSNVKDMIGHTAHIEPAKGSPAQNRTYCSKGGDFEEYGQVPKGRGKPALKCSDILKSLQTESVLSLAEKDMIALHQLRQVQQLATLASDTIMREIKVYIHIGPAGTGKTYGVWKKGDVYSKPIGPWWDGYTGQKVLLLDDYYGYLPYSELLRVLDVYPYRVPVKGGYVHAKWTEVHITSNRFPHEWYKVGFTPALSRRILKIIYHSGSIDDGVFTTKDITKAYNKAPSTYASPDGAASTSFGDESFTNDEVKHSKSR